MLNKTLLFLLLGIAATQGFWIFKKKQTCYDIFGENMCFPTSSPFTNTVGKAPESPADQKVAFALFTPANTDTPHYLDGNDIDSLQSSLFDSSKMTRVIIHGYTDNIRKPYFQTMKQELLNYDGSNVILVDWEKGADKSYFLYSQAAANTRVVGALLGKLMEILSQMHDVPYTTFHLIGHSLGAHVAGYAGSQLNGALGRISGLDPAGPLFEDSHTKVRLDSTDALFVDVIHTNGDKFIEGGLGTMVEMGDADFYPNGGMEQPGCASTVDKYLIAFFKAGFTGVTESVGCSHMRVLDLFSESINSPCQFTAYSCGTVEEFNAGLCSSCNGQSCSRMGFHADPSARGKFYLETNASPPFCKG